MAFPAWALLPACTLAFLSLVKGGKRGKLFLQPTYLGKAAACSQGRAAGRAAFISGLLGCSSHPHLADWAFLQRRRSRPSPLQECKKSPQIPSSAPHTRGLVLGGMTWQSSVISSLGKNPMCSAPGWRCPRAFFSALPSTTMPYRGEIITLIRLLWPGSCDQVAFGVFEGLHNLGTVILTRFKGDSEQVIRFFWKKYMDNNKSIPKCAVPRKTGLHGYWMIKRSPTVRGV